MLFDVIPSNFFMPLSSPGRYTYWECIFRLFSIINRQLSFGVEREVLVDELQFYFDSEMSADLDEEGWNEKDSRGKANQVLRKLESYGWISMETDNSYVQRVNFRDYAIQVIKTLLDISEEKKVEYQGYIFTIYSLVRMSTDNSAIILQQIAENTDKLVTGLKNLNANIKQYIDDLTKHSTVAQIMDALLNDYYTNVVDKAYHRLLTSDNVSKFRPEIIERLETMSRSKKYMEQTRRELAAMKEISSEEAEEQILETLHEIIETFRQMDDILGEINKKNTKYQRAAINRAKFLLTSTEDIRGQIKEILLAVNQKVNEEKLDLNAVHELEFMDGLIKIFSSEFLDNDSLYSPIEGKKEFKPEPMQIKVPDEELRRQKSLEMKAKMERILSTAKIEAFVMEQLGNRRVMHASEISLEDPENFIRLIYIRLYGQRKNVSYRIVPGSMVERGGYRFRDFEIWRKDGKRK